MADWTHLSLTADARRNLEAELDASRGDWLKTMQGIDDYVDELVADLFDPDDPEHSPAFTDPDAIADAARDIVSLAQEAADQRHMVQRAAWQEAAGANFPGFAGADHEDWTRVMWDVQKGFSNTDYNGLTYGQVMAGKARSGVSIMDLLPRVKSMHPDDLQQAYADFFRSMAVHAAQRQQMADIAGDPTKPRWARVPRGRVTCAFCTMLAGRGFVYTSEDAAGGGLGNVYHNHCDCEPVPTWGEAKLSGYDPDKLNAIYQQAKAQAPDGASYRDVLSRMRANGGVTDSPAAPGGGSGGKPPKPPKSTAAASPEPDEPRKSGNKAGGIIDAAKASEHRAMCREILEKGNAIRRYEALPAVEVHGYESWMDDQVRAETLKHDATWVRGGVSPGIDIEPGARPMEKEKACAERLSAAGFKVTFRATRAASKMRTSDLYILENGKEIAWEMKQPTGNGRQTISHQFEEAAGQSDRLIIDATAFQQGSRWSDGDALAKECEKLIQYHFKDSEGNAMRFSEVLIVDDANEAISIRRIIRA